MTVDEEYSPSVLPMGFVSVNNARTRRERARRRPGALRSAISELRQQYLEVGCSYPSPAGFYTSFPTPAD
ncbi:hypothetical protein EVAR_20838_1 [Eumeta japonica]|uniref:Uncharacterized protein n=1 Tax=Eumeta variegata TaxID=151549 RepID=A0A4C1UF07_EUMVA|nr:hypothetical protein EVAR_20838_1 [Eumeta japonica]